MTSYGSTARDDTAPTLASSTRAHVDDSREPWSDAALTWLGRAFDRMALRGMRLAFAHTLHPDDLDAAAIGASMAPYMTPELRRVPRQFFAFLDTAPSAFQVEELGRRAVVDGDVVTRRFVAPYAPYHCDASWPACVENDCIVTEHWVHRSRKPRATVLALHGFTMGATWIDAHVLMVPRWFELGYDVVLLALPFHGPRSPCTARYSGELFASWDVSRVNEAVRQAVHDIHLVKTWLAATTESAVGLLGLSLGGYLAAVMAGLCDDLAFVVTLVPPVTLDALAERLVTLEGATPPPVPFATLRDGYAVHSPLTHRLAVPRERALIVGARGDCVVPRGHAEALWHHWGEPAIHWYSGSHTAPFGRARLVARIHEHLKSLDLSD